jgi:hypothetical protein
MNNVLSYKNVQLNKFLANNVNLTVKKNGVGFYNC